MNGANRAGAQILRDLGISSIVLFASRSVTISASMDSASKSFARSCSNGLKSKKRGEAQEAEPAKLHPGFAAFMRQGLAVGRASSRARRRERTTTRFYTHPLYLEHLTPPGHPERRIVRAIGKVLEDEAFATLDRVEASAADPDFILLAHPREYRDRVSRSQTIAIDADDGEPAQREAACTIGAATQQWTMCFPGSRQCLRGARPPPSRQQLTPMGFCLFNNVIAALHARRVHGVGGSRSSTGMSITAMAPRTFSGRIARSVLLHAPDAALSRHGCEIGDRGRQYRQCAPVAGRRQRGIPGPFAIASACI